MKSKRYLALFAGILLFAYSCKKSKETEPTDDGVTEELLFHVHHMVSDKPLNFSSVFKTISGQKYTVSMLRYYLSNIRLVKTDGAEVPVTGKYLLVTPGIADYSIGQVPVGDYKGLKFSVGIDSLANHSDPTAYPAGHPLAVQTPAMHWSWNAGYIFTMIEGSCDTTLNGTDTLKFGQFSHGMFFHIGMDKLYRTVELNSSFSITTTGSNTLVLQTDLNKFFVNIDLKKENGTHTMDAMPLATKGANNTPSMFSIAQ